MNFQHFFHFVTLLALMYGSPAHSRQIPLPEHPRPDFQRERWINLNGQWGFRFDSLNRGLEERWFDHDSFDLEITVPFSWGSKLSGVGDRADIAWYSRTIFVPESWEGSRIFLVIGACDWITEVWVDGRKLGSHQGGYNQFEFDLTPMAVPGEPHRLVLRVDDTEHPFKLYGKQGYGEARGIWQTAYLEPRGEISLSCIHFTPDIDNHKVTVSAGIDQPARGDLQVSLSFPNREIAGMITSPKISKSEREVTFDLPIPDPHLWSLDDPYLYDVKVQLHDNQVVYDQVKSYFGMRKISIVELPGTDYPYVALNNRPLYLRLCLDQAYHPEGFYTYPSDEFMHDEIIRSKKIGLNGNRIHIKSEIPRKLYWADRLGLLIMADVPNFWGEPTAAARQEWEYAMREMIRRDYNHPSIFSWVLFNETWGLFTGQGDERRYLPETQEWVRRMFGEAKRLDPSRLIEDNSACNEDHVVTDLNTWHAYLPGYEWEEFLKGVVEKTFEGSEWNFTRGNRQARVPMLNSECGNVWGYRGSTGDVDWSWDYHIMMNEFRKHPEISGWLYTEHHDVINEWNGYYRYDRTDKITGLSDFIPDMTLGHLHSDVYLSTGSDLCRSAEPGSSVTVPLFLSVMTDRVPADHYILDYELWGRDKAGRFRYLFLSSTAIPSKPYFNGEVEPLNFNLPDTPGLYHLTLRLRDGNGFIYHLNFTSFLVEGDEFSDQGGYRVAFDPASFSEAEWSMGQWNILGGLKVNGAGSGYFSYLVDLPASVDPEEITNIILVFEASAKKLHGKDMEQKSELGGDYMHGKGTFDPSRNPNSYPMTDTYCDPTILKVRVNGTVVGEFYLEDDPADHRGVLSWHSQKRDRTLREAGSYGYLCKAKIPVDLIKNAPGNQIEIRFEVDESLPGGVAIYGEKFGRFPLNPTLLFE
jgi:hypothetical protein